MRATILDRLSFELDRFLSRNGAARFVSLFVVAFLMITFSAAMIYILDDVTFLAAFWWYLFESRES